MTSEPLVQRLHRVMFNKIGTMRIWLTDGNGKM